MLDFRKMGIFGLLVSVVLIATFVFSLFVERIPTGYVGVVYSINGGVQDEILTEGWEVVAPTKQITLYSIATEQLSMTKDNEDSFDVICKDGKMNIDLEMSYSFASEDVTDVFRKYRGMSGEDVVKNIVKNKIKAKVSEVTSQYTVLDAYMEKKAELNADITAELREYLKEFGITVESANISNARVDAKIEAAITERSQVAQELEIEKQRQEKARLEAETKVIQAQGEADKKIIEAKAEAEKNRLISESLTPLLVEKMEMEARLEHGWVEIQGIQTVVTTDK